MIPNIADEIERKTLDAIAKVLSEFQMGKLTNRDVYYAMRGIWDTASGLVSAQAMDILTWAMNANDPNW